MTKYIFLILLVFGLSGCTADPETTNMLPETKTTASTVVPVEEALEELYAMMDAISSETRSDGAYDRRKAIREITVSGGKQATRSGENDLPDTMVYVVNFSGEKGFAVLGAQRALDPVYAVTESGSFDAGKLDAAIAEAQVRMSNGDAGNPASGTRSSSEEFQECGTDFAYVLLAEALAAAPRLAPDTLEKTYGPWQKELQVGPLVEVKWAQTYPFNVSMPETTYPEFQGDYFYRRRFPVGCGPLAAAQMMTCTRRPVAPPFLAQDYSWTMLKSLATYDNINRFRIDYYTDSTSLNEKTNMKALADMLYHLGVRFKATYTPGGTGTYNTDIISGLKTMDPSYYANARPAPVASNLETICQNLRNSKPMCMSGDGISSEGSWVGHVWVVDGYMLRSRIVTSKVRYSLTGSATIIKEKQQIRYFHYNWGCFGSYDGYFTDGVFDMSRRAFTDGTIDKGTSSFTGKNNYYSKPEVILY